MRCDIYLHIDIILLLSAATTALRAIARHVNRCVRGEHDDNNIIIKMKSIRVLCNG